MAIAFFVAILIAANITPALSDDAPTVTELTARIRDVIDSRNYTCILSVFRPLTRRGPKEIYYRIHHSDANNLNVQPLTRTPDGKLVKTGVYFVKNAEGRFLIDPIRKLAVQNPRSWGGIHEIMNEGPFSQIRKNTDPEVVEDTLGSRDTWLIRNRGQTSFEFWIDKGSGFPLKFELFSGNNRIFVFEVSELVFIPAAEMGAGLFEIPPEYMRPPEHVQMLDPEGNLILAWLPLVPDIENAPEMYELDSMRAHKLKGTLVFQTAFAHVDTSEVVSVFQVIRPGLAKLIQKRFLGENLNFIAVQKEGVLLLVLGDGDDEFLLSFADIFYRDDEKARILVDRSESAINAQMAQ